MKNTQPGLRQLATALVLGTIIAPSVFAFEPIDGTLLLLEARDDSKYERLLNPNGDVGNCGVQLDMAAVITGEAEKSLARLFREVKTERQSAQSRNSEAPLQVRFEIRSLDYRTVKPVTFLGVVGTFGADLELEMTFESEGKSVLTRRQRASEDFDAEGEVYCGSFKAAKVPALRKVIAKAVASLIDAVAASEESHAVLNDSAGSNANAQNELAGLMPMQATYRVSEAEGVVRKKPKVKGSTVRKLGMGSQIQIIGKLPTGWLQVAKEGEAIGWIHEGSVTAMSVQSQPAMAAAPAKPFKPVPVAVSPAPTLAAVATAEAFPIKPVAVSFPRAKPNPDDVAVIIGNANYKATAKDIPDVVPAYADAEGMKRYAVQALGIKDENVIFIKDARQKDLIATFGTDSNPKGKLFNWVKPNQSNVFVFYSGHGAPNGDGSGSYLVPADAEASLIDLTGYSLKTLYTNLGKLPAKSVTVVLEACFSGASQSGMLVKNASPIYQKAMTEVVPANLTVISAGSGNQIASWEQDKSHGLFTKHYLLGMAGAADKKPYGNGDGKVSTEELAAYLKGTMSYMAQRYYGREQTVQVATGAGR